MWSIRARLLALDAAEPRAEVLKLASLVWVYTLAPAGRRMTAQTLARRLKGEINLVGEAICEFPAELLRWARVVGALGSVGNDEGRGWFIRCTIDACQNLHSESSREGLTARNLKLILNRVLYLEAVHGPMLADLAAELRMQPS